MRENQTGRHRRGLRVRGGAAAAEDRGRRRRDRFPEASEGDWKLGRILSTAHIKPQGGGLQVGEENEF